MFNHYMRIAFRYALRHKTYTLINVLGLSMGVMASILISFWVLDELSYDRYFENADRIYRIDLYEYTPQTRTPYPMANALVRDFPVIQMATSMTPVYGPNLSMPTFAFEYQETRFDEKNVFAADTNFFDVFSFEFIMGSPDAALKYPNAIVITREISEKYFGKQNPIGKTLTVNEDIEFMVTGVLENLPPNIHFHFDFLISYIFMKRMDNSAWFSWSDPGHYNYIVVAPGTDIGELHAKIPDWVLQYIDYGEEFERDLHTGNIWFQFTPIRNIHLHSNIRWELETNGNMAYVNIFLITALLVLIVACINYMNLATARFNRRAREAGIRKTVGAPRYTLIYQFLLESFLQVVIAVILAGILVDILLPSFSSFTGKDYSYFTSQTGSMILGLVLLSVIIGLIAGSYPAFYLSSFSPMRILKDLYTSGASVVTIRIMLVVFQFTVSIFLIVGTLTIFSQLKFINGRDLGFNKENMVIIPVKHARIRSHLEQLKESLLQYQGVLEITAVSNIPGGRINNNPLTHDERSETIQASEVSVDHDYIKTLGLSLFQGRDFAREFSADSLSRFIVNEAAVRELGLESPVNQRVTWMDDDSTYRGEIIGVIRDFHYKSLHENIRPLLLMVKPSEYNYLLVRLDPGYLPRIMKEIAKEWSKIDNLFTFEYSFLSEQFDNQYMNEQKMGVIFRIMAILAVIIASLGLFGLSTFTVEQKTQEIGIRKVHGAVAGRILRGFYLDFSKWILLAFVIASPLAYWGMLYWLRDFSYQITPSLWIFLSAVLITEIIALLSVTYQSVQASRLKPVDALRYD
jgi:putative ABC transport system permease protein